MVNTETTMNKPELINLLTGLLAPSVHRRNPPAVQPRLSIRARALHPLCASASGDDLPAPGAHTWLWLWLPLPLPLP